MTTSYDIKLTGEPLPGHSREAAAKTLAALMRLSEAQAQGLLSGRETVIKRGLAGDQVPRYLQALTQAGVMARHEPAATAPAIPAVIPAAAAAAPARPAPPPPAAPADPTPVAAMALKPLERVAAPPAPAPLALAPLAPPAAAVAPAPPADEVMECPGCGAKQPKRTLCRECGADMPRLRAAREEAARQPAASPFAPPQANVRDAGADRGGSEGTPGPLSLSFDGRIGRLRYLAYTLPAYAPLMLGAVVGGVLSGLSGSPGAMVVFMGIGGLATLVLAIRVLILRLHDLNLSGKWALLPVPVAILAAISRSPMMLIVGIGAIGIASLALTFKAGSDEDNDYGPPPGPNSGWVTLGAIVVIVFTVIGGFSKPNRFADAEAAASAPTEAMSQKDGD